jgi:serine/threonine protein kinase/lipopolysaccharide biosynthesis regulator YciM
MVGNTISHYKILSKLGEGGMGVVYEAEDIRLRRMVAVKVLPPDLTRDSDAKERFLQEARAPSMLDHRNICTIHEVDETEDGQMFIVMARYEGQTVKQEIERGPLGLEQAVKITEQVAEGLRDAHEKGIIHRDIKPANIMVTDAGQAKIMDFGVAKLAAQKTEFKAGATWGTVVYMSPEQVRGEEVDRRTDIWSVGVVLYEMLTGQWPFKGDYEQAVMYSILNEEPEPLTSLRSDVPAELESIVMKAMSKDPDQRYQNMEAMLAHLGRLREASATAERLGFVEPRRIAVISFENQTGDAAYDYLQRAIPNLLITSLEHSGYLLVTTWERMRDLAKQLGKQEQETIDSDLGFELCRADRIDTIVLGSFVKAGNVFATDVKVLDVETKKLIKSASSKGDGEESILNSQIDDLSKAISRSVGVSTEKIEARGLRIADAATASMDAYNWFLKGREQLEKIYNDEARQSLEKAIECDPTFAVAHLYLSWAHGRLQNTRARDEAIERAKVCSERATDKEKLYIEASYARTIEKDEEKRFRVLKQMARKYPKEKRIHHFLASDYRRRKLFYQAVEEYKRVLELDPNFGWAMNELAYMYADAGDFEKAREYFERYASVSPGDANPIDSMGELYFRMGRLDDAIDKYKEVLEIKPDFYYAYWEIAYVSALKEDHPEAMRWAEKFVNMAPSPGIQAEGYQWKGFYECWRGRSKSALAEIQKAKDLAVAEGDELWNAQTEMLKGWIYYDTEQLELSKKAFGDCLVLFTRNQSERGPGLKAIYNYSLGLVDLKEGRIDSARSRLDEIKSLIPEIESPTFVDAMLCRYDELYGEVLLAEGDVEKAITVCEKAPTWKTPYLSSRDGMLAYNLPFMRDTLARAYERKGKLDKAIAEYERLTTAVSENKDPRLIHPRYHYRLAKLYEQTDCLEEARRRYGKLLYIWKGADPNQVDIDDAKARLARLKNVS